MTTSRAKGDPAQMRSIQDQCSWSRAIHAPYTLSPIQDRASALPLLARSRPVPHHRRRQFPARTVTAPVPLAVPLRAPALPRSCRPRLPQTLPLLPNGLALALAESRDQGGAAVQAPDARSIPAQDAGAPSSTPISSTRRLATLRSARYKSVSKL